MAVSKQPSPKATQDADAVFASAVQAHQERHLAEAERLYREALVLNPNVAEPYLNLANILLAKGQLGDAGAHYERGLAINGNFPLSHHNLGLALAMQGKFAEAAPRFERAIALKPDLVDAYNDLARTLSNLGRRDEALAVLARAVSLEGAAETKGLFVQLLREHRGPLRLAGLPDLLVRALAEPWARPSRVGLAVAPLLRGDPALRPYIARAADAWPRRLSGAELWEGEAGLATIAGHRLLGALLTSAPVCDIALERFMTSLRFALLECVVSAERAAPLPDQVSGQLLGLCCALAQQCFLNEYIYAHTDEELGRANALRASLHETLGSSAGDADAAMKLAMVACYFPLHSLPGIAALTGRPWPQGVVALLRQHVIEPMQEQELRRTMPALTAIEDGVSVAVRQQYEENPYPRWNKCEPPIKPLTIDQFVHSRFPRAPFHRFGKAGLDILIAGCGTGQQAIEFAQRYPQARILAVDLSLSSLAYARRQALMLGRDRIEFAHADILKLGETRRSFDLIVVSGVLHHLADPFAGWQVLRSLLRPGGCMSVGLYSELARAHIRAARDFIAERGYRSDIDGIRACRQELMALPATAPQRKAVLTKDFFSASECRDLLFHVQEHRLTLPQIADFIAKHDLNFLGFDLGSREQAKYRTRFPADAAMTDLAHWHVFETENPDTFTGMYQFWVQSPPAGGMEAKA